MADLDDVLAQSRHDAWRSLGFAGKDALSYGPVSFVATPGRESYAWTNAHVRLRYGADTLVAKFPTIGGHFSKRLLRPYIEAFFNDSFLVPQTVAQSCASERATYRRLNAAEFPTFWLYSEQPFDDVLVTAYEVGVPLLDHPELRERLPETASLLRRLHDEGVFWGDAWLGNYFVSNKRGLLLTDFEHRVNPEMDDATAFAKDALDLAMSAAYRLGDAEAGVAILAGYRPDRALRAAICQELEKDFFHFERPSWYSRARRAFYVKPVYGFSSEQAHADAKRALAAAFRAL